jgi:hypothetical protein
MEIKITNLDDVKHYLIFDVITPPQAVEIVCKALKMIYFKEDVFTKKNVIERIEYLMEFKQETPIFFNLDDLDNK